MLGGRRQFSPARDVAYSAVGCALAIAVQLALSFVPGVELVTVVFVCFSAAFGLRRGLLLALSFTFLRGLVFGFSPTALVLYVVYYPFLSAVFAALGAIRREAFDGRSPVPLIVANLVLLAFAFAAAALALTGAIKVSRFFKHLTDVALWLIFACSVLLAVTFDLLAVLRARGRRGPPDAFRVIIFAAAAAVCTVIFTLLDDVITPLMLGYSRSATLTYFYASFTAMLPQTVCSFVSVAVLFAPVSAALSRSGLARRT